MTKSTTAPMKGAETTLWVYSGTGNALSNPLSDADWLRLAKVKELTPGEMTAESESDDYLDDENADWTNTMQGAKSAGNTSFTLAWMPGDTGQKALVAWFMSGDVRYYKIKYPNGTVDVFKGWGSSLGKAITAREVVTRTAQITNTGKPSLAEDDAAPISLTGIKLDKNSLSVAVKATATIGITFTPDSASDKGYRVASSDPSKAKAVASGSNVIVTGVAAGTSNIVIMTNDGNIVATCPATVTG